MVKRLTPQDRDRILSLYAAGGRNKNIASATGYGLSTITLVLREARAENDPRAIVDPGERALAMDDLFNRASGGGRDARSGDGDGSLVSIAAPITDRLVLSLANAFRGDVIKAAEAAAAYRKAQERKETSVAAPVSVIRFNSGPYRLGQSLHAHEHGAAECKRLGAIATTNFRTAR